MRTRVAASVAVVLSIALTVASSITSGLTQATSELGVLAGTIHDHTGTPVPGVTITLTGPERRTVITNPRGQFIVAGLLPGVYEALAELAGFRASVTKVTVVAGRTERVIVRMEVSTVQETVTVAGCATSGCGTGCDRVNHGTEFIRLVELAASLKSVETTASRRN